MKRTLTLLFTLLYSVVVYGQNESSDEQKLSIDAEFRPRTEFRNGYRQLRSDTTKAAFFTEQRSRIYINYQRPGFIFHTSFQDVRIWGEQDPRSTSGTIQLFESYVEPSITEHLSVRIGKQKIMYDNQRLFAQNNWRQNGGTHDGIRFIYKKGAFEGDLIGAFNQSNGAQDRFFGTSYNPGFTYYKVLIANFMRYTTDKKLILTVINTTDAFQDKTDPNKTHWRFTSGGRIERTVNNLYFTVSGYYQYGETSGGSKLSAYYFQPEFVYNGAPWTLKVGSEIFSGDDGLNPDGKSHSFDALYGVNHRFLGSMDFFTRFPTDLNNAGLIAPYAFLFYEFNKKITLRSDQHLFYSQNNYVGTGETTPIKKFLAFENDWLLQTKPNSFTNLDLGFSYAVITESMQIIKKSGNHDLFHSWAYLMVTFKPQLFSWTR